MNPDVNAIRPTSVPVEPPSGASQVHGGLQMQARKV
jgi:hypothetical protein